MPDHVLAFMIALGIALILTPAVIAFARQTGALDKPDARKVHVRPIPRIGGIGIYAAFMASILVQLIFADVTPEFMTSLIGLMIGGTIIVAIGIIDDYCDLPAKVKLLGQIFAAAVLVIGFDVRIDVITDPFGDYIYLEFLAIPATIFWVVGLTNTVNLIDGLDGLAAGVSSIAAVTIFLVAMEEGIPFVAMVTAALAGAAVGFLYYNFNPARIFMGDTGSMFLGFMLAGISVVGAVKSAATIALIVPILALGLPILDTTFAGQGTSASSSARTRVHAEAGGAPHVCRQRAFRPLCDRSYGSQHTGGGSHHSDRCRCGTCRRAQAGHSPAGCAAAKITFTISFQRGAEEE